jgi:hypothetical protein
MYFELGMKLIGDGLSGRWERRSGDSAFLAPPPVRICEALETRE